jgi:hypothetical protein
MYPKGYAANLSRGLNLETLWVNRIKSHDYHIWIERILPSMVWGYVPEHVWLVLAKLSYFFHQHCATELSKTVITELVCELEKIFPPGFFLPMQHLIVHLLNEARLGGVQAHWCYPIKRCLKTIHKKCTNKARIKASIAEASIREEVSNFTTSYYKWIDPQEIRSRRVAQNHTICVHQPCRGCAIH